MKLFALLYFIRFFNINEFILKNYSDSIPSHLKSEIEIIETEKLIENLKD